MHRHQCTGINAQAGMEESMKRVFLVVLDSVGIGELPDAGDYNDEGSHTLYAAS